MKAISAIQESLGF